MLYVKEHLVPHREQHVPPVRVKLRLESGLAFLQQRLNLLCHTHHEVCCRLAVAHLSCWVGRRRRGERAAGVLVTVSVEGSVAEAERRHRVIDGEFDQRHERRPVVAALVGKGAQDVGNDTINALMRSTLPVVLWWWGEPNTREKPRAAWSQVQKALVTRVWRSDTSTSGRPTSRNTDETKLRAAVSAEAVLKVGISQTQPVRR